MRGERFGGDLGVLEDEVGGRSGGEGVILEVGFWGGLDEVCCRYGSGGKQEVKGNPDRGRRLGQTGGGPNDTVGD